MALNSRRESEIFNYFYQCRNAFKFLDEDIDESQIIEKLKQRASDKSNVEKSLTAQQKIANLDEKYRILESEVKDFPVSTMGAGLSVEDFESNLQATSNLSSFINFHYIQKHDSAKHELIYTIKSDQDTSLLYLLYAPEKVMGNHRITNETVKNHLQIGGMGVKISHPFPSKVKKGITEMVTVLLDDIDPSKNYFFQLYIISKNGFQMSDPLRLVLNKIWDRRSESATVESRDVSVSNLGGAEEFIRNSYAKRSSNKSVQSVYERSGSPSNNSRYDKGG